MRDLRQVAATIPDLPPILFVHPGTAGDGDRFFGRFWPKARAIADPTLAIHLAFGIERRASLRRLSNPTVWTCALRAIGKGNLQGLPGSRETRTIPAVFLIENGQIRWQHRYRHPADHPDWRALPRAPAARSP